MKKNWTHYVDQCCLQVWQFGGHLIDLLSILLRYNGFTEIQKAIVVQTGSRPWNSDYGLFLLQAWLWEVAWSCFSVQSLNWWSPVVICCYYSVAQSCLTVHNPMGCTRQASLSFATSWSLPKLMSIESMMTSNHLILCCLLLLLPSNFPRIKIFSNELVLHSRYPKYWSFSFTISLSNEYSGLISFRIRAFLVAQMVKNHPAIQETQVSSADKGMVTQSL